MSIGNEYIGIEIGGTKLQVVLGDEKLKIKKHRRMQVVKEQKAEGIRRQIVDALKELLQEYKPVSIGVGFGGPVNREKGQVILSNHIEGWDGFPLGSWLNELSGLPVQIDNDANTAALGEALGGAGTSYRNVFYITLGSGMGGGMVRDRTVYHGAVGGESEIGLTLFDKGGANFESRCSGWAVDRKLRNYAHENPESVLASLLGAEEGGEAKCILPALEKGDKGAVRILDETADDLAFAVSLVSHLFHPEVVILGGGLSLTGEALRSRVEARLPVYMNRAFKPGPAVKIAALGEDVVCIGALLLAQQAIGGT
jgi:glucokinase